MSKIQWVVERTFCSIKSGWIKKYRYKGLDRETIILMVYYVYSAILDGALDKT
ncbi:MAG: hypothetical protein ACMUEL_00510 [Flavobacteriales bacterium Tduv]